MIRQIPNIITSLNLLCGCIAILLAATGDLVSAAFFVFTGIFFDFFDGLAARLLKAHSNVGLQLDSLADVVTSGVAPAVVMVQLLSNSFFGTDISLQDFFSGEGWNGGVERFLPFTGLLIAVASAYRLAKFNVDDRQTDAFIGLPTPANAILILSLPVILLYQGTTFVEGLLLNPWFLMGLTFLSAFLLNAEIELFALKFKTWDLKSNLARYVFLVVSLIAILALKFIALPIIIALYVFMSVFRRR